MQMISDNNSVTRDWSFLHRNITRCLTKAPSFSFNFSLVDRTTQFIPSFRQRIKFHEHPREQIQEFHEMLHFLRQFKRRSKIRRFLFSLPFRFIVRTSRSVARRSLQFQNATTNYARRTVGKKKLSSRAGFLSSVLSLFSVLRAPVAPLLRTVKRNEVFFSVALNTTKHRAIACKHDPSTLASRTHS